MFTRKLKFSIGKSSRKSIMGREELYGRLAVSNREEDMRTLSNTFLEFRMVGKWSDYDMSLGFIKKAGCPPPRSFKKIKDI